MPIQQYLTWTTGQVVTAANLNEQIRDNGNELSKGGLTIIFDGAGAAITTNTSAYISETPYKLTIDAATLFSTDTGDIVVDIWVPPTASNAAADSDSITASAPPTLSCDSYSRDTTLTGWTKTINEAAKITFYVESCLAIRKASLSLTWTRAS